MVKFTALDAARTVIEISSSNFDEMLNFRMTHDAMYAHSV